MNSDSSSPNKKLRLVRESVLVVSPRIQSGVRAGGGPSGSQMPGQVSANTSKKSGGVVTK